MLVPKWNNNAYRLENIIISLFAKRMNVSDFKEQIKTSTTLTSPPSVISSITKKVAQDVTIRQNRLLESVYCIVWIGGIVFKVRENSKIIDKAPN